jgi:hypothetical protein
MIRHPRQVAAFELQRKFRLLAAQEPGKKDDAVLASITASYFFLRRGLALIAFVFPIALWLGAGPGHLQTSISAYYHYSAASPAYGAGTMRNVFVGVLWAIGAFLYFYKGYSAKEDWALDVAGLAAAAIASFPMDWPPGAGATWVGTVHYSSATAFFLAIAFVCLFCSGDTLAALKDERRRGRFRRIYAALGIAMVAVPLAVLVLPFGSFVVLGIEVGGIWIFSLFWLVKSREIALIEAQDGAA